jgi:hypothetical protein
MPSPLLGAIIASGLEQTSDPSEDVRRIRTALEQVDDVPEAHARRLLIDALKTELEQLEAEDVA